MKYDDVIRYLVDENIEIGDKCVFGYPDISYDLPLPIPMFAFVCDEEGCECYGEGCKVIVKLERMGWATYWNRRSDMTHVLVSDRWCCLCGHITRVYIREDGALVFSHDEVGSVSVVMFREPHSSDLKRVFRTIKDRLGRMLGMVRGGRE